MHDELVDKLVERSSGLTGAFLVDLCQRIAVHGASSWQRELSMILQMVGIQEPRVTKP
mgnify:FL=1